nr:DUF2262 domain-containing protein [Bacillus pumilus]
MLVSLIDRDTEDREPQDIVEEAQKPVFYRDEKLGTFELVKGLDLFETAVQWGNQKCLLYFNLGEDKEINDCIQTARRLIHEQDKWDSSIKLFAANKLLELANDWQEQDDSDM